MIFTNKKDPTSRVIDMQKQAHSDEKAASIFGGIDFQVDSRYRIEKAVGKGAYGTVYAAIDTKTNLPVAIKKISHVFSNLVETRRTLREMQLMRQLSHTNILKSIDALRPASYSTFDDMYLVFELMSTDLHQIILSRQTLTDEHVQFFIYQVLRGIKYLHSVNILHRDLKPSNLLLNANCDLKICDFGLARVADRSEEGYLTEYVATRWYRAPEIMLSWKCYTKAIDIWSIGCIMGEILGGRPLFPGPNYLDQLHLIIETLGTPSLADTEYIASQKARAYIHSLPLKSGVPFAQLFPDASPAALDLLSHMLVFSPAKRWTVEQCIAHPYLRRLHDPTDEPTCPYHIVDEDAKMDAEVLKSKLWEEIGRFHPDLLHGGDGPRATTAPTRKIAVTQDADTEMSM